ncbi:MAG TPA: D-alanyl-D-alanine carboxypeptidase/D-alanyl-D-alanine-endopeptidase [Burkholderiales bacterium]|nr:D-alanyl-D-alanine carboxypeptidase/D-alanyl-D-alanine-endopeptidase [Burkholderiales bacterium]
MPRLFKTFLWCLALLPSLAAGQLPKEVVAALRAAGVPLSNVGVVVQEVGAARPSITMNAHQPLNPASTMKLLTTYAALELLGPAYRWKTEAYLDGDNLFLKGYGDPKLNYESFWMLLRSLRGRGLREIRGDVILDRSRFAPVPDVPFDSEIYRPYNVRPDALLVNFKSLRFTFVPDEGKVRLFVEPALPGLEVVNTLRLADGPCPEGRAFRDLVGAAFESKPKPSASFTGVYPAQCGEKDFNVALNTPEDYAAGMIRQLWAEMGGTWRGNAREGVVPAGARLVYTHESEPLGETVRDINKFSNNVMARQLFLTLAAELVAVPAQAENSARAIRQWLTLKGIRAPELVLENGSGLSRSERISAANMAAILQAAWRSPLMPEFISSLPVVAADGTMKKRMRGERVAGSAHIKTGLLNEARAIGGYVLDRSGKRHVVVMIVNDPRAPETDAAMDALLAWVYNGPTSRGPATSNPPGASPRRP